MKINYERTIPITPKLYEVRSGELFRPVDTERIFMRTNGHGSDEFTSEKETPLRKMFEDVQGDFEKPEDIDYENLIFCADMESGRLVLLDAGIKVEKIIGELMVKER
jgi:hypothetical protein